MSQDLSSFNNQQSQINQQIQDQLKALSRSVAYQEEKLGQFVKQQIGKEESVQADLRLKLDRLRTEIG